MVCFWPVTLALHMKDPEFIGAMSVVDCASILKFLCEIFRSKLCDSDMRYISLKVKVRTILKKLVFPACCSNHLNYKIKYTRSRKQIPVQNARTVAGIYQSDMVNVFCYQ